MKHIAILLTAFTLFCFSNQYANAGKPSGNVVLTMPPILAATTKSCDVVHNNLCYRTVISAGGRVWLDRNLGASRVATSLTDTLAYGDLYQWGRLKDGHEERASLTTSALSTSDVPNHSNFITSIATPSDWRNPQNDNLWQGVTGTNNPCPKGFRVPTLEEWRTEEQSWDISLPAEGGISKEAFESPLILVVAGFRQGFDGVLTNTGEKGMYWSHSIGIDSPDNEKAIMFGFELNLAYAKSTVRADGLSIRCIKD